MRVVPADDVFWTFLRLLIVNVGTYIFVGLLLRVYACLGAFDGKGKGIGYDEGFVSYFALLLAMTFVSGEEYGEEYEEEYGKNIKKDVEKRR